MTRPEIEVQVVVLTAGCGIYSFFPWNGAVDAAAFVTLRLFGLFMRGGHGVGDCSRKLFSGLDAWDWRFRCSWFCLLFYQDVVD